MKNIILQHWTGPINELTKLSVENMSKYAKLISVDYQFLQGNVFHVGLASQSQKLIMLDEKFDEYEWVVMVDSDMFIRKGMNKNIFTDTEGYGRHTDIQDILVKNLTKRYPNLGNPIYPYWGGSIYRMNVELRKTLREHLSIDLCRVFNGGYHDEGIMHSLAAKAKLPITEETYLPGNLWNCGSFESEVEQANFIHIRTKIAPTGPKKLKIENYKNLVNRGLIEG